MQKIIPSFAPCIRRPLLSVLIGLFFGFLLVSRLHAMPSDTASFRRRARLGIGRGKIISNDFLCDACGGAIHPLPGKELRNNCWIEMS
jgi:hypothetical protein